MSLIKPEKVKITHEKTEYVNTITKYVTKTVIDDRMLIQKDDINSFKNSLDKLSIRHEALQPGQKVFFDKSAIFPRRKFKELFPKNTIVRNYEKCDVIVLDVEKLKNEFRYSLSTTIYYPCRNGALTYYGSNPWRDMALPFVEYSNHYNSDVSHVETLCKRMNSIVDNSYKYIDISNLNIGRKEQLIDIESYEKIGKMLSSSDKEMVEMGINLLTSYNYDEEKHKLALLVMVNWNKIKLAKKNVECKSLLRKIEIDFPTCRYGLYNNISFWVKMTVEKPEDVFIKKAFNQWMKSHWNECPNLKIIVDEENNS